MKIKKSHITSALRILGFILSLVSISFSLLYGGIMFYQFLSTGGLGMEVYFFGILFLISSLVAVFVPFDLRVFHIQRKFKGIKVWSIAVGICFSIILFCHVLNDYSKDVFIAEFYWESGIDLHLRENGTYKAIYSQLIYVNVEYGNYKVDGDNVIIESLKLGGVNMSDTLMYKADKLHFQLEEEYKTITEGDMWIKKNELFKDEK